MTVMRSVFYVPGNDEKKVAKSPTFPADIITLDLEDSVPPAEKVKSLKEAGVHVVDRPDEIAPTLKRLLQA